MKPCLLPLADSALLAHFEDEIDPAVNRRVLADTLIPHADNVHAAENARLVREALLKDGIEGKAP